MMRNHCVEEADLHANEASQQGPGRGRYHFGRSLLCHHIDQSSKTCVPGVKGYPRTTSGTPGRAHTLDDDLPVSEAGFKFLALP